MKIDINKDNEIELSALYQGIVVKTPTGNFGICQRESGLEVTLRGNLVYRSYSDDAKLLEASQMLVAELAKELAKTKQALGELLRSEKLAELCLHVDGTMAVLTSVRDGEVVEEMRTTSIVRVPVYKG